MSDVQPTLTPEQLPYPPGPNRRAILGGFLGLARDPLGFMQAAANSGPVVKVPIGRERLVFVSDPAAIHELLVGQSSLLVKDYVTRKLMEVLGNGLLTSEGSFWRGQRKLISPLFSRKHLALYADTMAELTEKRVTNWADRQPVEVHAEMMALTLDIIFATVFGAEIEPGDGGRVSHAIEEMMDVFEGELRTWRRFVPPQWQRGSRARAAKARKILDTIVFRVIEQRQAEGAAGGDLVSRLLAARGEDGEAMSHAQVRDEAVTLLVAGHETTALVLTFGMRLLHDNPQAAATLHAELDAVLAGRTPGLEDLPKLPYVRAVVLETMRVFPPAYVIGRQPTQAINVGGFRVDPTDNILIPQIALHHRAEWFAEPEKFVPERWLGDLEQTLPEHAYMPFGGGLRVCVGQHFAMMEAQLCLAALAQRVVLDVAPGQSRELSPAVTLRPRHGVSAVVRRRTNRRT